jgi:hypothetical protein
MNKLHIMRKLTVFSLALFALIGIPIHANAAILTFQEGDGGAFSDTDASRFGSMTTFSKQFLLLGHDLTLNTDTSTVGRPDQYFMIGFFDLIGSETGQVVAGSVTDNATLRFTQTDNLSNGLQAVYRVLKPWDEDTVNNLFFSGTSALAGNPREP